MTLKAENMIRDGLALSVAELAIVANALFTSLHDPEGTGGVDPAWRAETVRRLGEMRSGAVELVDADEHYDQLRAELSIGTE